MNNIYYIDKNGNETKNENSAYAKTSVGEVHGVQKYYIRHHYKPANPMDDAVPAIHSFKKVSKQKFDYYKKFLETKSERYYNLARREME